MYDDRACEVLLLLDVRSGSVAATVHSNGAIHSRPTWQYARACYQECGVAGRRPHTSHDNNAWRRARVLRLSSNGHAFDIV